MNILTDIYFRFVIVIWNGGGDLKIPTIDWLRSGSLPKGSRSNCCKIVTAKRKNSLSARDFPRHSRCPQPNGMTWSWCVNSPDLFINRSGLNESGSGKHWRSCMIPYKSALTIEPLGTEYGPTLMSSRAKCGIDLNATQANLKVSRRAAFV